MITANGYAAQTAESPLAPWQFERRELGAHDVQIEILFCGVCHTDIHLTRNEEAEYQSSIDHFSHEMMITHIELLLQYSSRFYARQFIHEKWLTTRS